MNDHVDKRKRPSVTSLIAFGLMLFVVYALLPGLFYRLAGAGFMTRGGVLAEVIGFAYAPLGWCVENVEWVYCFYDWYFELCGAPGGIE